MAVRKRLSRIEPSALAPSPTSGRYLRGDGAWALLGAVPAAAPIKGYRPQWSLGTPATVTLDPATDVNGGALATGNLVFLELTAQGAGAGVRQPTIPPEWTVLVPFGANTQSTASFGLYVRRRAEGETTYTLTQTTAEGVGLWARLFWNNGTGQDPSTWTVITGTRAASGGTTNVTINSLATSEADSTVLLIHSERTSGTESTDGSGFSVSGGFTKDRVEVPGTGASTSTLVIAHKTLGPPGEAGPVAVTSPNAHSSNAIAVAVVIPPAVPVVSAPSVAAPIRQVFTASGTWVKPAGAARVKVEMWGGGGGGSGHDSKGPQYGGGGGGGGYVAAEYLAEDLSASVAVVVGSGGVGGYFNNATSTWSPAPGAGGTSSFGSLSVAGPSTKSGNGGGLFGGVYEDTSTAGATARSSVFGGGGGGYYMAGGSSDYGGGGGGGGGVGAGASAGGASTHGGSGGVGGYSAVGANGQVPGGGGGGAFYAKGGDGARGEVRVTTYFA